MKNKRNVGEFLQKLRISFASGMESVQDSGKALLLMCIAAIIVMGAVCVGVFFAAVKGSEEVLVPDVTGKPLTEAVQAMQVKELFPRIQMRYSDVPGDEGNLQKGSQLRSDETFEKDNLSHGDILGKA